MRLVQFVQVILLLALAAYVVLLQLENPLQVHLPLPGGLPDHELPLGLVLALALLLGGLYVSLLFTPNLVRLSLLRRQDLRARRELEEKLSVMLRAKVAGVRGGPLERDDAVEMIAEVPANPAEPPDDTERTKRDSGPVETTLVRAEGKP